MMMVGIIAAPFRVLSRKKKVTECLMLFKTYFLECSLKISDEHPHHFYMGHYNLEQYRG